MKKIYMIIAAVAALASAACTKESARTEDIQNTGHVQVGLTLTKTDMAGTSATKALQSSFEKGNTIFVFFNDDKIANACEDKLNNKEYLVLTYDGTKWTSDTNHDYLDTLRTTGTMDAFYVSSMEDVATTAFQMGLMLSAGSSTLSNGEKSFNDYDILSAEDQPYTIEDGMLKGTISLSRAKGSSYYANVNLQLSISDLPEGDWYIRTSCYSIPNIQGAISTVRNVSFYSMDKDTPCYINYMIGSSDKYVRLHPEQGDMVAYLGKAMALDPDKDVTFYLYDNATSTTYVRVVNTGLSSDTSSFISLWNGSDFRTVNTALKMKFSSFAPDETVDLSYAGTSNCYIVPGAGKYKFNATAKGSSTESVGTPASAAVLWESFGTDTAPSVGDLVSDVTYSADYISFKASTRKGNAVIAVKDSEGNILWSWHIWMTDEPAEQVYNNNAGAVMDRNLGATSAAPGDVRALGLMYQWGRKDPFLGSSSISAPTPALSTLTTWPDAVASDATCGTIAYAVANPTTFITEYSRIDDWYYTDDFDLDTQTWNNDNTRWKSSEDNKGLYDPCPAGYRVPDGGENSIWATALGSSFSDGVRPTNWNSSLCGFDFGTEGPTFGTGTIWYPAAGMRHFETGNLTSTGTYVYSWTCTPKYYQAYDLYVNSFVSIYARTPATSRASAMPVRCCKK